MKFTFILGYGDIVPSTVEGKILTIFYALYGIPVFLWYIIKLGALFRVVVMRFLRNFADCWKFSFTSCFPRRDRKNLEAGMQNLVNTTARPIVKNVSFAIFCQYFRLKFIWFCVSWFNQMMYQIKFFFLTFPACF